MTNNNLLALKDIESFCNGRIELRKKIGLDISAYKDVLFLVRQHIHNAELQIENAPVAQLDRATVF